MTSTGYCQYRVCVHTICPYSQCVLFVDDSVCFDCSTPTFTFLNLFRVVIILICILLVNHNFMLVLVEQHLLHVYYVFIVVITGWSVLTLCDLVTLPCSCY